MCRPSEVFLASTSYTICAKPTPKVRLRVMHGLLPCGTSDAGDSHIDLEIDKHSCASNVEPSTISHLVDWRAHAPTAHSTQAGEMTGQHSYLGRGGKRSQAGMQVSERSILSRVSLGGQTTDLKCALIRRFSRGKSRPENDWRWDRVYRRRGTVWKVNVFLPFTLFLPLRPLSVWYFASTKLPFLCILDDTQHLPNFELVHSGSVWSPTHWFTLISSRTYLSSSNMVHRLASGFGCVQHRGAFPP
ncbi:hypothetical protein L210DRAFT_2066157 [Boletus edulis BED1]|uniref:Uncharacterized protein n=1 Tax=Boletus edulis BED1 TaxID=1328754 RepID=A0AAD4GFC9_BOLED|nr:hypothetical protein L210DRAFT_2066157 [Boletus edulis BED1]